MADREIRLIGSFKDDITPKLDKLNRRLLGTLKQFEKLQQKIAPVAAEMAKFNTAAAATSGNLKSQRSAIEENIRMLRQYRVELSRTATAQSRMGSIRPPRGPRGGGSGGGGVGPVPPLGGRRPTPLRGGGGDGLGAGIFGVTLGNQLASIITGAVVAGFRTGAQIMMTPFKFGAQALGERIRDEMSDVRTAGGLFSISKRMQKPLFGTFAEAEDYTKEQNRYLAKLAGSLPGSTQEYIQVSKQIADGIFTVVSQDAKNAQKLAAQLAQERGATAREIAKLSQGGPAAMQQTGKEIVGEMTKLTVLAGLGGAQGAYGLPQLTERMIAEDQISMGMFQRYAAIFRDPMIKGALERNIAEINKAGKNTTARLEAIRNTFREIVTPELVRRYQRTTAGVLESLRTTFLNPEVGLLGLGRPLGKAVQKFNDFGQAVGVLGEETVPLANTFEKNGKLYGYVIDKMGRVTDKLVEASMEQISIFDRLRDVFANVMIVLEPIITNLASFFDPLLGIGASLDDVRKATMWFQSTFERYRVTMMKEAERLPKELRAQFEATVPMRSAFQALNNAMVELGAYGDDQFKELSKVIIDPKTKVEEFSSVLRTIVDKFLNSDAAKRIGEAIGMIVGTVIAQVGEMMKVAAGLATASKLAEGFAAGFQAAGGPQGFRDIIRSVFALFGKLLIEAIKAAPLESAIAAALFFLPGAIAGVIGQALSGGFATALAGGGGVKAALAGAKTRGASALADAKNFLKGPSGAVQGVAGMGKGTGLGRIPAMASGIPKNFMAGLKAIGPKLLGLSGIISAVIALLEGKSILDALAAGLGSAGGTAIGAAIGTVIFPGIGTAIGAAIGGWVGTMEFVTRPFSEALDQIGSTIGPIFDSLGQSFNSIIQTIGSLLSIFGNFGGEVENTTAGIIAVKILLTPIVAAFQLLEQVLNLVVVGLKGLELAVLYARMGLSQLNPFGSEEKRRELTSAITRVESELDQANGRFRSSWERHSQWYTTEATAATSAMQGLSASANAASGKLSEYQAQTQKLIEQGKVSSAAGPSQADRDWYKKMTGKDLPAGAGAASATPTPPPPPQPPQAPPPPPAANPVPALQALNVKQASANAFLAQLKVQMVASANIVKNQIGASSNAQQAKIQGVTTAVNNMSNKLSSGVPVRIVGTPTVKFDMGGVGPVGGGIGGFPKTSGYGMRWGKMHTGNDYGMPIGTKLGIGGPGRVLFAGNAGGYGKMMDIGGPGGMVYRFAHLSKFNAPVGAMLPPGFPFALSGNTGRSTGPHLHFEARPGGGGPVPPDAFANIIRANFVGTPFGPLMGAMENEMKGMPYGAQLAVANSDEIFMKPKQMASVIEASTRAGAEGTNNITTGPITISIDGYNQDPKVLTETIASELIAAMYRKSRSEVLTS